MRIPRAYRQNWDWWVVVPALLLLVIGLLAVSSATHHPESPRHGYFVRHVASVILGLGVFAAFLFIPLRLWEDWAWLGYGICLVLLVAVLFLGVDEYGARRWFRAGPIRFQPSELAKLATIFALARFLAGKRIDLTRPTHLGAGLGLAVVPWLLVLKEPDLGTSGAFPGIALVMLVWAGLPWLALAVLVSPLVTLVLMHYWYLWAAYLALMAAWLRVARLSLFLLALFVAVNGAIFVAAPRAISRLHPYQQQRIATFLNPEADPAGAGYQVLQSKIAIGSGQALGRGYRKGTQNVLAFLPQQHTDFVYSVVGEELGFVGGGLVILLFATLILRSLHIARSNRWPFASLVASGIGGLILYHTAINMAMTMGLFPVTGLPLPLLSYGGSFLLTMMAALGLLENAAVHRYDY